MASEQNTTPALDNSPSRDALYFTNTSSNISIKRFHSRSNTGTVFSFDYIKQQTLREPWSVFNAELLAVLMAIGNRTPNLYTIVSDSMSVLMALETNFICTRSSMHRCRSILKWLSQMNGIVTLLCVSALMARPKIKSTDWYTKWWRLRVSCRIVFNHSTQHI